MRSRTSRRTIVHRDPSSRLVTRTAVHPHSGHQERVPDSFIQRGPHGLSHAHFFRTSTPFPLPFILKSNPSTSAPGSPQAVVCPLRSINTGSPPLLGKPRASANPAHCASWAPTSLAKRKTGEGTSPVDVRQGSGPGLRTFLPTTHGRCAPGGHPQSELCSRPQSGPAHLPTSRHP